MRSYSFCGTAGMILRRAALGTLSADVARRSFRYLPIYLLHGGKRVASHHNVRRKLPVMDNRHADCRRQYNVVDTRSRGEQIRRDDIDARHACDSADTQDFYAL